MNNRSKFFEVFGLDISYIDQDFWLKEYKKYHKYKITMYDWYRRNIERSIEVYAVNKTDARKKAIDILGSAYQRYLSGRPWSALKVERVDKTEAK